jgi:hypothetical protein
MMNSSSLKRGSNCSSISHFQPFEEFGAACFAHLLLKFGCFQPIESACANALRALALGSLFGRKPAKTAQNCSHQTPQTGEKVERMNSSSPKRGSYCSLLTELNKRFFSLLLSVSDVKNNGNNTNNNNNTIQI